MAGISTHVLDTSSGMPAAGLRVQLSVERDGRWQKVADAETDEDGRVRSLLAGAGTDQARYLLEFDTAGYAQAIGAEVWFPTVVVVFPVLDPEEDHHVPLLLSPFGYSVYRGV